MKKKKKLTVKTAFKPRLEWQTGDYSRQATFAFTLPYPFLLLCRLLEVTPYELIENFMNDLSMQSWQNQGREHPRQILIDYVVGVGYGRAKYTPDEIKEMFREMNALGLLYPKKGDAEMIDLHTQWRDAYHHYWFEKWNTKFSSS